MCKQNRQAEAEACHPDSTGQVESCAHNSCTQAGTQCKCFCAFLHTLKAQNPAKAVVKGGVITGTRSDLEGEIIKQEGEAAEGHFGCVDGHAASGPALGCYQVGIVRKPGVSHNRAVWVHHHLP